MSAEIWVAIITGVFTFLGVVVTVRYGNKKHSEQLQEQSELTLYRISELEKKQDKHNTLIERMYAIEKRMDVQEEKTKVANHRIDDIEEAIK